jgi:hypothetical protein
MPKFTPVLINLTDEQIDALRAIKDQTGSTVAEQVRQAVADRLAARLRDTQAA